MKLPLSLLLLAALGQATPRLTTERTFFPTPALKRELREGNFGDRTGLLQRYAGAPGIAGIHYAEELKQELEDQTPHNQIFGARLSPTPKISDLLTGHGPSFEVALANHLYSPVSAYNAKPTSPGLFQVTFPEKTKKKSKSSKKPKTSFDEDTTKFSEFQSKDNPFFSSDVFSSSVPLLTSTAGIGEESSLLKPKFSHKPSQDLFLQLADKPAFKFASKYSTQNPPAHYYQPQSLHYAARQPNYEYYNRDETQDGKENRQQESRLLKFETAHGPEYQAQPAYLKQAYHSHPNGAVSYASYTSDPKYQLQYERPVNGQPRYQLQYEQTTDAQQQAYASQLRHQQPIYVPDFVYASDQPQAHKPAAPETQQQYVQVPQQQYVHVPQQQYVQPTYVQQTSPAEKPEEPQYVVPQTQYKEVYLNPARHQLLHELEQGSAPQAVQYQQQQEAYVTSARPQPESAVQPTYAPVNYQPVPQVQSPDTEQYSYAEQPTPQPVVNILPQQRYPPTPPSYRQPVVYHTSPSAPQYPVTPKAHSEPDQLLQATTIEPEILNDHPQASQAFPRSLSHQSTARPHLTSPKTLQALHPTAHPSSTPNPHYHVQPNGVQIQQQELQEIHSAVGPLVQQQHSKNQEPHGQQQHYVSSTPSHHQSPSTPQPTEPTKPDFEIEISTNVDNSELPKDLRPANNVHEEKRHHGEPPLPQEQPQHQEHKYHHGEPPLPHEHTQHQEHNYHHGEPPHSHEHTQHKEHNQHQDKDIEPKLENTNALEQPKPLLEHSEPEEEQNQQYDKHEQSQVEQTQPKVEHAHPDSHPPQESYPQQELQVPQEHQYQQPADVIQPPNLHIPAYDPNTPYLNPILTHSQPILQAEIYSNGQDFVVQPPHFPESRPGPTFPAIQYFGKFAQNLFSGLTH